MVFEAIKKAGKRTLEGVKKGDVGSIAKAGGALATGGASIVAEGLADKAKDSLDNTFATPKPKEVKAQDTTRTDEEKSKLRQALVNREQKVAEAFDPAKFQTRQAGTQALGQSLRDNLTQVSADEVGNIRPTTIATPGTRQAVSPDFSGVDTQTGIAQTGQIDFSSPQLASLRGVNIGLGQGATAQSQLLQALQQQAAGQGPSLAANQLQQAQEANLRAALAQQASLRGGFDPAAARQIRQSQADLQAQAAQDAAQARIQEQMAARQQLASVAGNIEQQQLQRGQLDLTARGQEAQQDVAQAGITQNAQKLQLDSEIQRAASSRNVADQQIAMANTVAQLEDKAVSQEYDANFRTALAQGQIDANAAMREFDANLERTMTNMEQQNSTIRQIYQNDVEALKDDIDLANRVYLAGVQAKLSIDEMKFNLENMFQQEGMDASNARVVAENAFNNAMYQRELAIKQAQQQRLAAGLQTVGTLGGAAVGAMAGNPAMGAQLGGAIGGGLGGAAVGQPSQAPTSQGGVL